MARRRESTEMRLLIFIDSLRRAGAETSMVQLVPYLRRANIDVHFTVHKRGGELEADNALAGVPIHSLDAGKRLARVLEARNLIRRTSPDLIHTVLFESDLIGRPAGRMAAVPVLSSWVSDSYSSAFLSDPAIPTLKARAARTSDWLATRCASHFHAVSQVVAHNMGRRMAVAPDRITVIPRSRSVPDTAPIHNTRYEVRRALSLSPEHRVVLAVGRQEHVKGFDVLIKAAAECDPAFNIAVLIAGGAGRATPDLQRMVAERDMRDRIRFLGVRTDVPQLLHTADAFVLCSRLEGFPNALLEAMAHRTVTVASDIPAVREMTIDGQCTNLFPVGDHLRLADEIVRVTSPAANFQEMVDEAYNRFLDAYRPDVVIPQYVRLYEALAGV